MAHARFLRFTMFLFLVAVAINSSAFPQKHVVYPTVPTPPHSPQEILLLFTGDKDDDRILLTLNNNRPDVMIAAMTVYTSDGLATVLPNVQLIPQESRMIELKPILATAGLDHQQLGWLKLDYNGVNLELGAQLTLYPTKGGPGFDSPRSLSGDFKSAERDTVFWMPAGSHAHLALTNSSSVNIFIKMRCGVSEDEFTIGAKATKMRNIDPQPPSILGGPDRVPMACELTSTGAIDALRPVGSVVDLNYAAPIRFYDPKSATSSSLTAVGVDTESDTHVIIHNVTDLPVQYVPVVREAALNHPQTLRLPSSFIAAHTSAEVVIDHLLRALNQTGVQKATLTVETGAPKDLWSGL